MSDNSSEVITGRRGDGRKCDTQEELPELQGVDDISFQGRDSVVYCEDVRN